MPYLFTSLVFKQDSITPETLFGFKQVFLLSSFYYIYVLYIYKVKQGGRFSMEFNDDDFFEFVNYFFELSKPKAGRERSARGMLYYMLHALELCYKWGSKGYQPTKPVRLLILLFDVINEREHAYGDDTFEFNPQDIQQKLAEGLKQSWNSFKQKLINEGLINIAEVIERHICLALARQSNSIDLEASSLEEIFKCIGLKKVIQTPNRGGEYNSVSRAILAKGSHCSDLRKQVDISWNEALSEFPNDANHILQVCLQEALIFLIYLRSFLTKQKRAFVTEIQALLLFIFL